VRSAQHAGRAAVMQAPACCWSPSAPASTCLDCGDDAGPTGEHSPPPEQADGHEEGFDLPPDPLGAGSAPRHGPPGAREQSPDPSWPQGGGGGIAVSPAGARAAPGRAKPPRARSFIVEAFEEATLQRLQQLGVSSAIPLASQLEALKAHLAQQGCGATAHREAAERPRHSAAEAAGGAWGQARRGVDKTEQGCCCVLLPCLSQVRILAQRRRRTAPAGPAAGPATGSAASKADALGLAAAARSAAEQAVDVLVHHDRPGTPTTWPALRAASTAELLERVDAEEARLAAEGFVMVAEARARAAAAAARLELGCLGAAELLEFLQGLACAAPDGKASQLDGGASPQDSTSERKCILACVEEDDDHARMLRVSEHFSGADSLEIESFRREFSASGKPSRRLSRANTLLSTGGGSPWGICSRRGGEVNSWDDVDGTTFSVRGPGYLRDRAKAPSASALLELLVVDLFRASEEIVHVSTSDRAKTVHRVRREGEERTLLVLSVRLAPLHLVAVWALPAQQADCPASRLASRLVDGSMGHAEVLKRLKVIPRIREGPWVARRIVGENSTTVLGRNLPLDCFRGEGELEVSVNVASSAMAERICRVLQRAAQALHVEVALLLEGQSEDELPERILGGFRLRFADLSSLREL